MHTIVGIIGSSSWSIIIIGNTGQITNTTQVDIVMEKVVILDRGGWGT